MRVSVGDSASLRKVMREADVRLFADLSLDTNPVHVDEEFAAKTRFGRRICPGMLYSSLISAVIGTRLPGPGTISSNARGLERTVTMPATSTVAKGAGGNGGSGG